MSTGKKATITKIRNKAMEPKIITLIQILPLYKLYPLHHHLSISSVQIQNQVLK